MSTPISGSVLIAGESQSRPLTPITRQETTPSQRSQLLVSIQSLLSSTKTHIDALVKHVEDIEGWVRDLTRDGIEPNPGPRNNVLDKLTRAGDLSEDGKAYLIQLLDPFHDLDIDPIGMPDTNGSSTVAVCLQQSFTVSAPVVGKNGYASGANYDAHIFTLPELSTNLYQAYSSDVNQALVEVSGGSNQSFGPVNAITTVSGANTFPTLVNGGNVAWNTQTVIGAQGWDIGSSRLVGIGIEVINSTADIGLQGVCTVYRSPQGNQNSYMNYQNSFSTPQTVATVPGWVSRLPPNNVNEALLLNNTRQWPAAEGCYLVGVPFKKENPLEDQVVGSHQFLYPQGYQITAPGRVGIVSGLNASFGNAGTAPSNIGFSGTSPSMKPTALDTAGVFFSGLSSTTTLQVNVRMYIEKAPTPEDSQLAILARRSAKFDALALELLGASLGILPPGVMLKENPAGEWFNRCIAAIRDNSPWIGQLLHGAGLPGGVLLGQTVSNMANIALGNKAKKKKALVVVDSTPAVHKVSNSTVPTYALTKAQRKALAKANLPVK